MRINDRAKRIAAAIVLAGGLILGGCGQQAPTGGPPLGGTPEVAVVTVQLERVAITTELAGRTSAYLAAEVRPQVGGIIQKRLFNEGGDVKTGDVLYQIDPATYHASFASASAALARSEANLIPLQYKAERYRELLAINAVSRQDYDDITAAVKQAEADIEAGKAAVETARIHLAYTRITAPISGRIGKSNVTVGALVTAGQGAALATIQQLNPVYVDVTQSSADLLRLKRNMASGLIRSVTNQAKVKLLLEDGSSYPLEGTLKFSDVTVDPGTGSVTLRTIFPNPKQLLLPGMYVRTILEEGVNERAILVPQQAVTRDQKGTPLAMVVDASNKVEQRALKIDRAIGDKWLISEGLNPSDRLIVEGFQKIKPGATVKVVPLGTKTSTMEPAVAAVPTASKK
jgi:membrane fusion protein (multidrug efflux system)